MKVQVFGLQRSGTNYVEQIIRENFRVRLTKKAGWKHGLPDERRDGSWGGVKPQPRTIRRELQRLMIQPVVVRKDLDHWLGSIARNPMDFDRGDPEVAWHEFYEAWSFAPIVRYEDFLEGFRPAVRGLGKVLGQRPRSFLKPETVQFSEGWRPEDAGRYL